MKKNVTSLSRRALLQGVGILGVGLLLHKPATVFAAIEPAPEVYTQTRIMLGTFVSISVAHHSKTLAEEAMGRAFDEITQLESQLTRHDSASPLSQLNAAGKLYDAPPTLTLLLDKAQRIHALTSGSFDVTVAPLLDLYRAHQNPKGAIDISSSELQETRALVGTNEVYISLDHVRLGRSGMSLTLDGIAKGFIADRASAVLASYNAINHLINAGGDIRVAGQKAPATPWRVGVENPLHKGSTISSVPLYNAMATSGCYEVYYDAARKHHHLIDPSRKVSPLHTLSVTVTAPTAMEADALATALSILPTGDALKLIHSLPGRECTLITQDGRIIQSATWGKA